MKEEMYVIATRGRNNKEIYLACSDKGMIWTENIDDSMATFSYTETENCAKNYFKTYNKWYIKSYLANFS